jgi:hypothetical protein
MVSTFLELTSTSLDTPSTSLDEKPAYFLRADAAANQNARVLKILQTSFARRTPVICHRVLGGKKFLYVSRT